MLTLRCLNRRLVSAWSFCRHDGPVHGLLVNKQSPSWTIRKFDSRAIHYSHGSGEVPNSNHASIPARGSTIYALSTAPGRAAIAVIRISGPEAIAIYKRLCPDQKLPRPRYASVCTLYEPATAPSIETMLDSNALVFYFPAPRSATGEDILELHVHGGPAIVKSVLGAVSQCGSHPGSVRYADAGDFTRRAFMNNRMELTQIEALGESLNAVTEQQRRLSVRGTVGGLGQYYDQCRERLLAARGELEALIDFSEDQHFDESPTELITNVASQVAQLQDSLSAHTQNAVRGELLRSGISISLLGAPNAGKSSLLNRIVGREAAIVSHEAGTTRDVVEVSVDIGGFLCRFGDTAGLRRALGLSGTGTVDEIGIVEQEGIRRAKARATESDLVIVVVSFEQMQGLKLDPEVLETAKGVIEDGRQVIVVVNKIDERPSGLSDSQIFDSIQTALPAVPAVAIHLLACQPNGSSSPDSSMPVSTHGKDGIAAFLAGLVWTFHNMTRAIASSEDPSASPDASIWQESLGATERQRLLLEECSTHLALFLELARYEAGGSREASATEFATLSSSDEEVDFVLAAEHLRAAAGCLASITGKGEQGDVEEVLGVVFERFCVGK